ncbi:septal ring lytic transglycosylase RlpA family protein [Persicimonas caeni]|uniref:Probable endolytic peptidoglycan transglycosylase RlpA n=1 Tax=Persicimonas caeni TaxID=2292766 RepID=A0A4Y6PP02_PERCE|nr:septal ring lytic transglycosylase RlpA family protein [Persicimonas caeni]QDG49990.1 septal ring lytic transglycosylase RlpA family protein [Persicimonas caeni]QED31211.1 septal ring lytic transglycosylase RlpA family protein [Persicimonas caeni]
MKHLRFLIISLIAAFVLNACGSTYDTSRIRDPKGDLITDRAANGPDGKKHALSGGASWYGKKFHGRTTASGEPYDMYAFTAAHKTLPFHTVVRVIEPETNKSVVVRINDRGPYHGSRIIDLSFAAATDLDLVERGVQHVELEVVQWGDGSRVRATD